MLAPGRYRLVPSRRRAGRRQDPIGISRVACLRGGAQGFNRHDHIDFIRNQVCGKPGQPATAFRLIEIERVISSSIRRAFAQSVIEFRKRWRVGHDRTTPRSVALGLFRQRRDSPSDPLRRRAPIIAAFHLA